MNPFDTVIDYYSDPFIVGTPHLDEVAPPLFPVLRQCRADADRLGLTAEAAPDMSIVYTKTVITIVCVLMPS